MNKTFREYATKTNDKIVFVVFMFLFFFKSIQSLSGNNQMFAYFAMLSQVGRRIFATS